jgi:hypothetical protein
MIVSFGKPAIDQLLRGPLRRRDAQISGLQEPLLFGRWVFRFGRAEHAAAQDIAEELLRSAERGATRLAWLSASRGRDQLPLARRAG